MKTLRLSFLLFVFSLFLVIPAVAQDDGPDWTPLVDGIDYRQFDLLDPPNQVYVTRLARANPNLTIETSIAQGRLSGGLETVTGMAVRYDQALNYWGQAWGNTNQVVVAINGFYYDPESGVPYSGQVHSGWYAKRFSDHHQAGFAWQLDRDAFIGDFVFHYRDRQVIHFLDHPNQSLPFDGINIPRVTNQLILYTPQFDATTRTDHTGLEVQVQMDRPALLLPTPTSMATGTIVAVRSQAGSTPIPFDHVVLSAHGSTASALLPLVQIGGRIGISQEIANYPDSPPVDWTKTYASLPGDFHYLVGGEIQEFTGSALVRDPRTAIAFNADYIFFIVVDGRDPGTSAGMTIQELAEFSRDVLQAEDAIAQDGGGSSTMVINGQVVNNTYCNIIFCTNKLYLPLISGGSGVQPPAGQVQPHATEGGPFSWDASGEVLQRWVANGLLMVVVQPEEQSLLYAPGDSIVAISTAAVRLGPGDNYARQMLVPAGTTGEVLAHPNGLDGVSARGSHWWLVRFGAASGWVVEEQIVSARLYELAVQSLALNRYPGLGFDKQAR
ncbi:MAG: phosphodiester glycosidase family protein [Anaerolineales bacterium]|nr:phosphodiester glycosidase family protein [Anaerolineales bacterium]